MSRVLRESYKIRCSSYLLDLGVPDEVLMRELGQLQDLLELGLAAENADLERLVVGGRQVEDEVKPV